MPKRKTTKDNGRKRNQKTVEKGGGALAASRQKKACPDGCRTRHGQDLVLNKTRLDDKRATASQPQVVDACNVVSTVS